MDFLNIHKESIIVGVIIFVVMLLIMIMVGMKSSSSETLAITKTPWKQNEYMRMPWQRKNERLFSGDLSPQEQSLYNKLSKTNPTDSSRIMKSEYMNNKSENPNLSKLLRQ